MGKSSKTKIGYHYRPAYHVGLCRGEIDAFLEFRAADKPAWIGALTQSGRININRPQLFGGESDQGGIVGAVDVMFGDADQLPNAYLRNVFGPQVVAWRGLATLAFCGGRFGAMNPMPQRPAYKLRKIVNGWDGGCWYPEMATVALSRIEHTVDTIWSYKWEAPGSTADYSAADYDHSGWETGPGGFGGLVPTGSDLGLGTPLPGGIGVAIWIRRQVLLVGDTVINVFHDDGGWLWVDGQEVELTPVNYYHSRAVVNFTGVTTVAVKVMDGVPGGSPNIYAGVSFIAAAGGLLAMNPAHALYYVRTDGEKGREPRANINDASLRAAADRLFTEGFGLCWEYDPTRDTPDGFEERICRIIGGAFERSLTDGQWYLDLARGDYQRDTLPVIGDDDILEFREQPTTLDRAVNSISIRYFDPERKESVITPAVRAIGLIRQFGEIHETLDFAEIPSGNLALRVAERELRARISPTRIFELVVTPRARGIRRNQYFRLQTPKRGIVDMVCIIGEKDHGSLRSGALRLKVSQDVYAMPETTYAEIEHGVDTRPPQVPEPITTWRAFEAPYIDVVATLPRAELEALPVDAGFLLAIADDPGEHLDFTMYVAPHGGEYSVAGNGDWCPTARIAEAAGLEETQFTLIAGARLERVTAGTAALWGEEWVRVDAVDNATGEILLGRGCADTTPGEHFPGERIWFLQDAPAVDVREYAEGETVAVKLASNTGSARLPLQATGGASLTFAARQARPYPPGDLRVGGERVPSGVVSPAIEITIAHRDRTLQADQLVDATMSSIGPEPGTHYIARYYSEPSESADLIFESAPFSGTAVVHEFDYTGEVRLEVSAVLDGLESWQPAWTRFIYSSVPVESYTDAAGEAYTTSESDPYTLAI